MKNLEEIFNSVQEDEVLILSKALSYECALSFLNGGSLSVFAKNEDLLFPKFLNSIGYKIIKRELFDQRKLDEHLNYLEMASIKRKRSYCKRRQVGALIVKDKNIISEGYNGTPSGFENDCEDCNGETHWYVKHAEENAILKVAKSTQSTEGATLYNTLSPCRGCSKMILGAGITKVFFVQAYKDLSGVEFLLKAGIDIYYIPKKLL